MIKKFVLILQLLIAFQLLNATQKVVNCTTAGQLETYFSSMTNSERYDISHLTVTGQINARDIYYINVSMSTDTLILTNADILAYTGAPFYESEMPISYPENEFPTYAFKDNTNIKKIMLPSSIVSIGERAFEGAKLKDHVTIPYQVVSIKNSAFSGCTGINFVSFPNSLKVIGANAFLNCEKIETLVLPANLETIGMYAFYGASSLTAFNFPTNLKSLGDYAFGGCSAYSTALNLPGNVNYGSGVFNNCSKLPSVTLNAPMDTIPDDFFKGCTSLTQVNLPQTMKVISAFAFQNTGLSTITLPTAVTEIGFNSFTASKLKEIEFPSSIKLGEAAFSDCDSLKSINLNNVTNIGDYAFSYCDSLKTTNLSNSITQFGKGVFKNSGLTIAYFPNSGIAVPESTYEECSRLKSVHLPEKVPTVSANAFKNCVALDSIFSKNLTPPFIETNGFLNVNKNSCKVFVPEAALNSYKEALIWREFLTINSDNLTDKQIPQLTASYPSNGATGITQTPGITLRFNKNVKLKQNGNLFIKIIEQGKSNATFSYSYLDRVNTDSATIYFEAKLDTYYDSNPDTLKTNTNYKLLIPAGMIVDNNGNAFNSSDYEINFSTGSKNLFHTLFYPAGDIKYLGGRFLGGTTGASCGAVSNRYHMQTSSFKRELMENEVKINLFTKKSLCYYTFDETIPAYSGSKYFLEFDEVYDGSWNLEKADEKATFELSKFKESNNPISDLILKIKYAKKGLNVKTYSNGVVNNSITINETSHDGLNYRYLHVPVLNNAQVDSMVVTGIGAAMYAVFIQYKQNAKPLVNLGQDRGFCSKEGITLDAGFSAGASYAWNTGAKTQTIEVHTSGLYSVAVTNSYGTTNAQVTLTAKSKPILTYNKQTIVKCSGENITLAAPANSGYSYQWSASHSPLFSSNERTLQVIVPGMYSVRISNGGCDMIDTVYVEDRQGARVAFMNQSCCFGYSDLRAELYAKNQQGNFYLYKTASAPSGGSVFDSIPAGEYIYESHVNQLTMLTDNNPWVDTYHNGKTDWKTVTAFKLNCLTDTTIAFEMAKMKMDFAFNGTGAISGTIQVIGGQINAPYRKMIAQINDVCDTKIMLYEGAGNLIASTCPDANGNYSFTNLPAGNYTIKIERTGYELQSVFTTSVENGEKVVNVNFSVDEGKQTIVSGMVNGIKPVSVSGLLNVRLSPNPARIYSSLEFELKYAGNVSITISDLSGRILSMRNCQLLEGKNKLQLDVQQLYGMYFVKVSTSTATEITRLIVQ